MIVAITRLVRVVFTIIFSKKSAYEVDPCLNLISTQSPIGLVLKMVIGGSDKFVKIKNGKHETKAAKKKKFELNFEQSKALRFLEKTKNKFDVSVLQGTTGSGKTLVYFERIKKVIEKNSQALVLLPEIFLTNDFKSRFEDFFGFEPAIWHSKVTPKKKRIIWNGVINNNIKLVV